VLQKAEVEVVVDLRGVGNNVQEHHIVGVSYRAPIPSCLVTMVPKDSETELKEEFESDFLTLDALNDPDELRKQTEL
jgi:hypothetical protein